jgi:large subunit ribosomal protein L2
MGKTLIQQARGKGSLTYRVKRSAFSIKPAYPKTIESSNEYMIIDLVSSGGHTSPIIKLESLDKKVVFHNLAPNGSYVGQKINLSGEKEGDIAKLKNIKTGTKIYNIESRPGDGGKFIRSGGNSGILQGIGSEGQISVLMPSKKEKLFNPDCRATVGIIAGGDRLIKPILKAGKKYYIKKTKSKLWPRTSAVKMNAIDHPFGGGRGKRIKSKIAKRNAPPGRKVGLIRPRRTGRKKR